MHVCVCIVGFRHPEDVRDCLAALSASTHRDFEVVVCENGGPQAYAALTAMLAAGPAGGPPVRVIDAGSNLGYAGGVNVCLRAAPDADAWWVLNPDTLPRPEALERMVAMLSSGEADAIGSTIFGSDGEVVESRGSHWRAWLARAVSIDRGVSPSAPPDPATQSPAYFCGASMLVGRRFLEATGPMREDYFLYAEEIEWCLRGAKAGMRLRVAVDAEVIHHQGTATGSVTDPKGRSRMAVYLDERNKLLVTRDCYPLRLPVVAVAALALLFLRFGRRGAWRQLGYAISGWFAGLRGVRGRPAWVD